MQAAGSRRHSIPWDAQSSRQVVLGAQNPSAWHLQESGGGVTQLCSPFSVLDVNDESPTFFPAIYNVSLPENVARDFKVVRLNCTDADVGLNAELSYFITGKNPLAKHCGGDLWSWKGAGLPRTVARVFCASASSSPSKPWLVSPSAEQPRSAPCLCQPLRHHSWSCSG